MAENITTNEAAVNRSCDEPVCIDARRVYDSCGDKDCLSDLPVFFTDEGQQLIDSAVNVRLRDADVLNVMLDIEPVPFHRGFYSIDMTYFFLVTLDVFTSPCTTPASVTGLCISDKKVILYGSEGNVRIFSSDLSTDEYDTQNSPARSLPTANVQVAQPIPLAATLKEKRPCHRLPRKIPTAIENRIGGSVTDSGEKIVLALSKREVGADIERVRPVSPRITRYFCCEADLVYAFGVPRAPAVDLITDPDALSRLFEVWTFKEALGKAWGTGLTRETKYAAFADHQKLLARDGDYVLCAYECEECI